LPTLVALIVSRNGLRHESILGITAPAMCRDDRRGGAEGFRASVVEFRRGDEVAGDFRDLEIGPAVLGGDRAGEGREKNRQGNFAVHGIGISDKPVKKASSLEEDRIYRINGKRSGPSSSIQEIL
jgi:hypothetical protein